MKELIEKLKEQARPKNIYHTQTSISLNDLQTLLNAIEERWVPVTERLPEEYQEVLFFLKKTDENGLQHDVILIDWTHGDEKSIPHLNDARATHWMPLPTLPKG